jgi:hypothetical protein
LSVAGGSALAVAVREDAQVKSSDDSPKNPAEQHASPVPEAENLRVEYQAAQDSAQHHDALTWTITSVIWGASLVLMGFILNAIENVRLRPVLIAFAGLGIVLAACVWAFASTMADVKRQKYERCQYIEAKLGMAQHRDLRYPPAFGRKLYAGIMIAFLAAWITVICRVLR